MLLNLWWYKTSLYLQVILIGKMFLIPEQIVGISKITKKGKATIFYVNNLWW